MGFPPVDACGPTHGASPIIALELVRDRIDLAELIGPASCAEKFRAAQLAASWWDAIAFIPAYCLFLILGAAGLRPPPRHLSLEFMPRYDLAWNTMGLVIVAAVLDELEGAAVMELVSAGTPPYSTFGTLFWVVRSKFFLLGLAEIFLALLAWRGTPIAKAGAAVMAAGGLASLWFLFNAPHDPMMMLGHRYAWMALLALAAIGSINYRWVNRL